MLAGWSGTWVVQERERLRLVCVNAPESAAILCARGETAQAQKFAIAVVRPEPLRETS